MIFRRSVVSILLSGSVVTLIWLYDWAVLEHALLPNSGPDFSIHGVAKTAIMAVLSAFIIAAVIRDGAGRLGGAAEPLLPPKVVIASYGLLAGVVLLYVLDPGEFHRQSLEDSAVEYASAILLLIGALFYLIVFLIACRLPAPLNVRRRPLFLSGCGAAMLFVMGMEELSWMQRIFDVATPEALAGNGQDEINLHNFETGAFQAAYRAGAWAVLIMLPFVIAFGPQLPILRFFRGFLPDRSFAAFCVPMAGLFYNAWPFMPNQIIFFTSPLAMLAFYADARRGGRVAEAALFGTGALAVAVAQGVFLLTENRFGRLWDISEYQECFIAMGLATLGYSTFRQWAPALRRAVADKTAALEEA